MTRDAGWSGRLVVGLAGPVLDSREAQWLRRYQPAGVILFARNCAGPTQLAALCADLRAALPERSEIMADHEGGPVSVLTAALGRPPAAWTLGVCDDPSLTQRVHQETARRARAAGIDRLLAPCCDVLIEARNPVIGSRAFGEDPPHVARHVAAAVAGLRAGGVRCCLKHWPGHGGTRGDTHETAAREEGGAVAEPFRAGLAAGADGLMVGHLARADGDLPWTLDTGAVTALRRDLGAGITLFADDVTMGGLRTPLARQGVDAGDGRGEGMVDVAELPRAWLDAIAAGGCDRLLVRGIPWRACPLDDGIAGPRLPLTGAAAASDATAAVYAEARTRAASALTFGHPDHEVLWCDATQGDRWGAAAGCRDWLAARFAAVCSVTPDALPAPAPRWQRLLVTSHRPLARQVTVALAGASAAAGLALVAGHPSLGPELGAALGPGWRLQSLADCAVEDLAAVPREAAQAV